MMSSDNTHSWSNVLGDAIGKPIAQELLGFDPNKAVIDAQKQTELWRKFVGSHVFESLRDCQRVMKSDKFPREAKNSASSLYSIRLKIINLDIGQLISFKNEAVQISLSIFDARTLEVLETKIIPKVGRLISKQMDSLRKIHCRINPNEKLESKKYCVSRTHESLSDFITEGDYETAVSCLLALNNCLDSKQIQGFFDAAQEASTIHPEDSGAFMAVLEHRFFSKNANVPLLIDYSELGNNPLLEEESLNKSGKYDPIFLLRLWSSGAQASDSFGQAELSEQLNSIALKPLNELIDLLAQDSATGVDYSLMREFRAR